MYKLYRIINSNKKIINILILISFLLISIINVLILLHNKSIYISQGEDMPFHWKRISELLRSKYLFPQYALNSFSNNGSAVMTMYPYLFIIPFAIIFHLIRSVVFTSIIMFFINTLVSLIIDFYSSLNISKNIFISYLFALMYSLSSYSIVYGLGIYDLGMFYSYLFIPLVIFGFIYWIQDSKWYMLTLGMTLIIYSNVIISLLMFIFLLLWIIYNYRSVDKVKIFRLIKSNILTFLLSSSFTIPFIKLFILNKLRTPYFNSIATVSILHSIQYPQNPLGGFITVYSFLGIIIGIIMYKRFNNIIRQLYIYSIILLLISSKFPWKLFNNTSLHTIQYTGRILIFSQVLLTYVLAVCIVKILLNKHNIYIFCTGIVIILSIVGIQLIYQVVFSHYIQLDKGTYASNSILENRIINKGSSLDYYPQKSLRFSNNIMHDKGRYKYKNGINTLTCYSKGNGEFYIKHNKKIKSLSLPILYYYGTSYSCYLNHKKIKFTHDSNQLIKIYNIPKGHNNINVNITDNNTILISRFLNVIGLVILIIKIIKMRLNNV